jgi:hypothetical protein
MAPWEGTSEPDGTGAGPADDPGDGLADPVLVLPGAVDDPVGDGAPLVPWPSDAAAGEEPDDGPADVEPPAGSATVGDLLPS